MVVHGADVARGRPASRGETRGVTGEQPKNRFGAVVGIGGAVASGVLGPGERGGTTSVRDNHRDTGADRLCDDESVGLGRRAV